MMKHLCTISMIAMISGMGMRDTSADDTAKFSVAEQRQDDNRREFEGAIKELTAHLKELRTEAAELLTANKPDRFEMTQKKIRETVEKLEQLKSRFIKSRQKPKPRRKVRRKKEVRRVKERRREREPRRERAREQRTELDGPIEKMRAKFNELKKKAEDLARTDKKDAQELVQRELREVGGQLERLMGERNRRLAARRQGGEGRERDVRRDRPRREGERREKDGGPMTELNNAIKRVTAQHKGLKKLTEKLADSLNKDGYERVKRQLHEVGGQLERLHGQRNRLRRGEGERREKDRGPQTELNNAIEKATAQHNALKKQAEKLAGTDNRDALERVRGQLREAGGYLERLHGMRNRQREERGERGERRERDVRRERDERSEIHPEIRAAMNRLEHMQAAIAHLKESGLTEIAQVAAERAEKLEAVIDRSRKASAERREREGREKETDRKRGEGEGHRDRERRSDSDGAMREIGQAVRQLTKQLKELREEVNGLKKKLGDRK